MDALGDMYVRVVAYIYIIGGLIVGGLTFLGGWIYAVDHWGLLLGGGLGWIPAAFLGLFAGATWPLLAAAAAWLWSQANA